MTVKSARKYIYNIIYNIIITSTNLLNCSLPTITKSRGGFFKSLISCSLQSMICDCSIYNQVGRTFPFQRAFYWTKIGIGSSLSIYDVIMVFIDWQCSRSCGGGVQKRAVWCINEESGEEEKMSLCAKNNKPDSVQDCNPKECKPALGKLDYIILYSVCFSGPKMYLDT